MAWFWLVVAGLLEACWAVGLKYTHGFTKPVASCLTILGIALSMYLLAHSARTLPIGTAYVVWVGIGSFGAAILGIALFDEQASLARMFFLGLLAFSIAGLKFTSG